MVLLLQENIVLLKLIVNKTKGVEMELFILIGSLAVFSLIVLALILICIIFTTDPILTILSWIVLILLFWWILL